MHGILCSITEIAFIWKMRAYSQIVYESRLVINYYQTHLHHRLLSLDVIQLGLWWAYLRKAT
jgi:hypothetical protein